MKIIIYCCLLVAGVIALPASKPSDKSEVSKKTNKFPKKYNKAIHGQKTQNNDEVTESSYLTYDLSGALEALNPPPATSYVPQTPSKWNNTPAPSGIVRDTLLAPSPDTYSSYGGIKTEFVKAPAGEDKKSDVYMGYAQVQEGKGDNLRAPSISSYVEIPAGEGGKVYLLPPAEQPQDSAHSSYMSYSRPSKSSYVIYVKNSDKVVPIQPPS